MKAIQKAILACLILVGLSVTAYSQGVKYAFRGVVTYFFNENEGDRADVGAKAYIIKETAFKALKCDLKTFALYNLAYAERELGLRAESLSSATDQKFKNADAAANRMRKAIIASPLTTMVTADGNGVFTKKLAPGAYCVLVVSSHRQHESSTGAAGQVAAERFVIKNDDVELPFNFGLY